MKWNKLDARLAAAVGDPEEAPDKLNVFVAVERMPTVAERCDIGIPALVGGQPATMSFTASVSPKEVDILSEQGWVRSLNLSQVLQPLRRR